MSENLELDAAPDWLTVTTQTVDDTDYLRRVGDLYVGIGRGSRTWRMRDYRGRQRHDDRGGGGVAFGERMSGQCGVLQAWGAMSSQVGRYIAEKHLKSTRIDLAVTVLHQHAQRSVEEMLPHLNRAAHKYSAIVPLSPSGGTLYIGSRSSSAYGRLYDKGAQMGGSVPPRMMWRYEVEYKGKLAQTAGDQVWYSGISCAEMRDYVLADVEKFFCEHGVPTPFTAQDADRHSLVRYASRIEDAERTIKWLSEQVNPAVLKLQASGRMSDIIQALGVGVRDGMPLFETVDVLPAPQLKLWPELD